jgi:hypothetical protein
LEKKTALIPSLVVGTLLGLTSYGNKFRRYSVNPHRWWRYHRTQTQHKRKERMPGRGTQRYCNHKNKMRKCTGSAGKTSHEKAEAHTHTAHAAHTNHTLAKVGVTSISPASRLFPDSISIAETEQICVTESG